MQIGGMEQDYIYKLYLILLGGPLIVNLFVWSNLKHNLKINNIFSLNSWNWIVESTSGSYLRISRLASQTTATFYLLSHEIEFLEI